MQSGGESIPQVLKNKELLQETKKPYKMLQGENLPQVGFEQDSKEPCFYGTSDDADNERPRFCPHSNYFEQILTLFDELDEEEQKQILNMIVERLKQQSTASN